MIKWRKIRHLFPTKLQHDKWTSEGESAELENELLSYLKNFTNDGWKTLPLSYINVNYIKHGHKCLVNWIQLHIVYLPLGSNSVKKMLWIHTWKSLKRFQSPPATGSTRSDVTTKLFSRSMRTQGVLCAPELSDRKFVSGSPSRRFHWQFNYR